MRTKVFRVLAGLVAVGFVWVLVNADHSGRTVKELLGLTAITTTFAAFAFGGPEGADRVWASVSGGNKKA